MTTNTTMSNDICWTLSREDAACLLRALRASSDELRGQIRQAQSAMDDGERCDYTRDDLRSMSSESAALQSIGDALLARLREGGGGRICQKGLDDARGGC